MSRQPSCASRRNRAGLLWLGPTGRSMARAGAACSTAVVAEPAGAGARRDRGRPRCLPADSRLSVRVRPASLPLVSMKHRPWAGRLAPSASSASWDRSAVGPSDSSAKHRHRTVRIAPGASLRRPGSKLTMAVAAPWRGRRRQPALLDSHDRRRRIACQDPGLREPGRNRGQRASDSAAKR